MLSIVIPCHNEVGNIAVVVNRFIELAQTHLKCNVEIILVNDASTDNTKKEIEKTIDDFAIKSKKNLKQTKANTANSPAKLKHPTEYKIEFKMVDIDESKGYGNAILSGLKVARGDILAWTHADMQTDPSDLFVAYDLWSSLKTNQEQFLIKGVRKNRKLLDVLLTFGMSVAVLLMLRVYLTDINAQPKMFSRKFYNLYLQNKGPLDFSLDLYSLYCAQKNKIKIHEFPVFFKDRLSGEAKGGGGSWKMRLKLIRRTLIYIWMTSINQHLS